MSEKVAIYCRLSEEDKNKHNKDDDSGSIQNQKLMLMDYADQKGWEVYKVYSDDDYTGSDRNRPAFNQMLSDARMKRFDIVLCKTQSRFTRELEIVEKYIHGLFPELGIRFVSIVDNIDTDIVGNKKSRQINGLINEWYLEDMSDSIKAALRTRMKAGYFIGSFAPYGYQKDPQNKGHLIVDEDAAEVVREIFHLYIQGIGRTRIARILNERGIPAPEEYSRQKGIKVRYSGKKNGRFWKYYTVSHILENEVYIGTLVQGKTHNPTYKSKHSVPSEKEQWIKVEKTHEAIIDRPTWDKARKLWEERSKPSYTGEINKYSSVLICSKCGYHMGTAYNHHKRLYRCGNAKYGKQCCPGTSIFESTLDSAVLRETAVLCRQYLDRDALPENDELFLDSRKKIDRLQKQKIQYEKKIDESDYALKNLYIDKLKGIISERQFMDLSDSFTSEKESCRLNIQAINNEIEEEQSRMLNDEQKEKMIREMLSFDEVSRLFIDSFVDRIEVGGTQYDRIINIYWKF